MNDEVLGRGSEEVATCAVEVIVPGVVEGGTCSSVMTPSVRCQNNRVAYAREFVTQDLNAFRSMLTDEQYARFPTLCDTFSSDAAL